MINRNNYEEYFLLLADNELSVEEADRVKQFAAQHPDLAEELDILLSCRLVDTPMPVFPKEKLLRPIEWDAEKPEPVQTKMLLLLDDELPAIDKQQLQQQIADSAMLQTEWNTLQQTKLVAEAITHPNKATLQHTDRKIRPLLWMRWAAAAAVVAGFGWLLWTQQAPPAEIPVPTLASNTVPEQKGPVVAPTTTQTQPIQNDVPSIEVTNTPTTDTYAAAQQRQANKQETSRQQVAGEKTALATDPAATEKEPAEAELTIARLRNVTLPINAVEPVPVVQIAHLEPQTVTVPVLAANHPTQPSTRNQADVLLEENDFVTIGTAHVNRQKMRGLLRNVTRTVARGFSKSKMEPDVYVAR